MGKELCFLLEHLKTSLTFKWNFKTASGSPEEIIEEGPEKDPGFSNSFRYPSGNFSLNFRK